MVSPTLVSNWCGGGAFHAHETLNSHNYIMGGEVPKPVRVWEQA